MADRLRILFIGDIVGEIGRKTFLKFYPVIKQDYSPHIVVVNGENSAAGKGITPEIYKWFLTNGVNAVTLGNHTWAQKKIFDFIDEAKYLVRPANFSSYAPGQGVCFVRFNDLELAVVSLQGRVFMGEVDDPFATAEHLIPEIRKRTPFIVVDFHAEATSEKQSLGLFLDGQVSAFLGTHTHVQTTDSRILPKRTAYITDVGMTGAYDGVIGVEKEAVIQRFRTQMPNRFVVPKQGRTILNGVIVDINENTGLAGAIMPISMIDDMYEH